MGLGMFWADVAVRNPLSGDRDSAPDVPHITADALDAALSKKNEWRDRLSRLVHEFNGIAPKLRSLVNRKLTEDGRREEEEVANRARPLLRDIILLLEQDRYFSGDGLRYGKLVENELGDLPDGVVDLRFFVGKDASGDPGFYAWAFIAPERSVPDEKLFTLTRRVRPLIEDAMYRVAGGHFAYLSFRGVGETIPQGEDEEVAA
jgi:hypothetical protein